LACSNRAGGASSGGGAATVTPDQITGLRAWWKADTGLTTTSNVAAQFTFANTEYLSAADNAVFPSTGDWTFAVWVKADSFTARPAISSRANGTAGEPVVLGDSLQRLHL
jgi:hypothetical protein